MSWMTPIDYIILNRNHDGFCLSSTDLDPYENPDCRGWDQMLHRALIKIFSKRCRGEIKELLGVPDQNAIFKYTITKSIFQEILELEPALNQLLIQRNKLSLLWVAVLSCFQKSAELLVYSGADVNQLCKQDIGWSVTKESTLLHALVQMYPSVWNQQFIDLLIEHDANWKAIDFTGVGVMHLALEYNRVKLVKMLIEKGADLNARFRNGGNVLHHLAQTRYEQVDLARLLIEKGVSLDYRDSDQYLPIHTAVRNGKIELVNLLLDYYADVNTKDLLIYGEFLLYLAALSPHSKSPAMILTLLKRGANIDLKNSKGSTALHVACYEHQFYDEYPKERIKLLLSVGADVFVEDHKGLTPFHLIRSTYMRDILMVKMLALRKTVLHSLSIELKDERIIKRKYPQHWNHYQDCLEEISRLKSARFTETCTVFDVLTRCHCHIAKFMRIPEFKEKFKQYDLSIFPLYAKEVIGAFEHAERFYHSTLESVIKKAVSNILSYIFVRKVVRYTLDCEICEIKETVRKSRSSP